jgi:metal-responsive CopG/Arc/MetJ family transcriptional regulator
VRNQLGKPWIYIGVSIEQTKMIDQLKEAAKKRGIHKSRANFVAEALAEYFEKPNIKHQLI